MYLDHPTPIALRPFIRRIMIAEVENAAVPITEVRPTGYSYLGYCPSGKGIAHVDGRLEIDTSQHPVHVSGQVVSRDITIAYEGDLEHVLVEFTALGLYELLGVFGEETIDSCKPIGSLRPDLEQQFSRFKLRRPTENFDTLVSDFLVNLTKMATTPNEVPIYLTESVERFEACDGQLNISDLCNALSISRRNFSRQFTRYVGQTPKRFCQILQINRALQAMIDDDAAYLAGIAADAGFSDQAHFNNVFRQNFLTNPLEFLNSDQQILRKFLADRSGLLT